MLRTSSAALILSIAIAIACSAAKGKEGSTTQSEPRTIEAVRAEAPPVLDGKLDDACWQKAQPITHFRFIDSDRLAIYQSIGYVCCDDQQLFIGMKCLMPKGATPTVEPGSGQKKSHDSYVFSDDIVEIMLEPGNTGSDYYQLAINAFGSKYDSLRRGGGAQNDPSWNGDWMAATDIVDGYWSVEISIPFHALGISSNAGSTWRLNLCRESKPPYSEYSSIAVRGAFHNPKAFAVLKFPNIDFNKYFVQIDSPILALESSDGDRQALFSVPIKNMSGQAKQLVIERWYKDRNGREATESKKLSLESGESAVTFTESLDVEALAPGRSDAYIINTPARTSKLVVSDADNSATLALAHVPRPWFFEPMLIEVRDPWQKETKAEKSSVISADIHLRLSPELLKAGELVVNLTSPHDGKTLASQRFAQPSEKLSVTFPADELAWGLYDVQAVYRDAASHEVASSRAPATVLPGGKQHIKVLNNFVSELMNVKERGLAGEEEIEFMNPRNGWVFISVSGSVQQVRLDSEAEALVTFDTGKGAVEAMRYLPVGRHVLHLKGKPDQIVVRAIPELFYSTHPSGFEWEFLKSHVLHHCNTILGGMDDEAAIREWTGAGKKWLTFLVAPGHGLGGEGLVPADQYYGLLNSHPGFTHPLLSGVMVDQIGASSVQQKIELARAVSQLATNPKFRGREYRPWYEGTVFGSEGDNALMKVVRDSGGPFSYYYYLTEKPTELEAKADIRDKIIGIALGGEQAIPGSIRSAIVTLGYWSDVTTGHILDIDPTVNFKVLLQMQFEALANDPALFGLYGAFWYYSPYPDEEILRWSAQLYRHYGIEGKTTKLTDDPYRPTHIRNPDFENGIDGWTIREAEPDLVKVGNLAGYGDLQGRFVGGSRGDTFLVTKRSAERPNIFSQEIKDLVPGRTYSVKMITADHGNITTGKSVKQQNAIAVEIENVDLVQLPGKNEQTSYPNHYGHPMGQFHGDHHAYLNFHWYVFRAKANTAVLNVSDWANADEPGGPAGQEVMYNFIQVEPYLEE